MLKIKQLKVQSPEGKIILNGIDLDIQPGEVHVIMGPNGSGKSTLSHFLAGKENFEATAGSVQFCGQDLLALNIEERAKAGLFLGFQYPVAIPGVNNMVFIRSALNEQRKARGEKELDAFDFMEEIKQCCTAVGMNPDLLKRDLNAGFSGGEKKRNEIVQLLALKPKLSILDEIDSGLDIDALKDVAAAINALRNQDRSFLLITHYQRLLNDIQPDRIHILKDGKIIRSGDAGLAKVLEQKGYTWLNSAEPAKEDLC
jgi:Fe-S cluster assembly ATP-binding protein